MVSGLRVSIDSTKAQYRWCRLSWGFGTRSTWLERARVSLIYFDDSMCNGFAIPPCKRYLTEYAVLALTDT